MIGRFNLMEEKIILVNKNDIEIGSDYKIKAHKEGKLHRAFSIFIFNSKGELLIQKRAKEKYHSGGLWSNSCCGHPEAGEKTIDATNRRLFEEMGIKTPLKEAFSFIYNVRLDNGIKEYELDHVFVGFYDGKVVINKEEAEDFKWINIRELIKDINKNPEKYSYWFRLCFKRVLNYI